MKETRWKPRAFEGFEIWWNEFQMKLKYITYFTLFFTLLFSFAFTLLQLKTFPREKAENLPVFLAAEFCVRTAFCPQKTFLVTVQGQRYRANAVSVVDVWEQEYFRLFANRFVLYIFLYVPAYLVAFVVADRLFYRRSKKEIHEEKVVRGEGLISARELSSRLKKTHGKGRLQLSEHVKLPRSLEARHIFVVGASGTGKTVFLSQLLARLQKEREKCVVFDLKGDYVARFFRPEKDIILNPFDRRAMGWDILFDIEKPSEALDFARSFIPSTEVDGVEKYFRDAAAQVLAGILRVAKVKGLKTSDLWDVISSGPVGLKEFLESHEEGRIGLSHIQKTDSNQAAGVTSTLMQFCRVFEYMRESNFSLRAWVREEGEGNLFLPVPIEKRETLSPLITAAVDVLIREVLSMPDNLHRRRFFFVDELGALQKLNTLIDGLTLGRSKGLSLLIGIQDFGKIDVKYSRAIRETVWNNCATRVIFRVTAPDSLEYLSRAIGEIEVEVSRKTMSMGVEDFKDGLSYTRDVRLRRIFLPAELAELPDLVFILRVGEAPPARDTIPFRKFEEKNAGFLPVPEVFEERQEKGIEKDEEKEIKTEQERKSEQEQEKGQEQKSERDFY